MNGDEAKFDFERDGLVAVITQQGHPRKGQHIHVGPGELLHQLQEHVARMQELPAPEPRPATLPEPLKEIVSVETKVVEKLDKQTIEQIQFIARGMDILRARLEAIEGEGFLRADDANHLTSAFGTRLNQTVDDRVAEALGDIRGRLAVLEQTDTPQVSDQIQKLATAVHAFGGLVQSVEDTLEEKADALEGKYAAIARHISGVTHTHTRRKQYFRFAKSKK